MLRAYSERASVSAGRNPNRGRAAARRHRRTRRATSSPLQRIAALAALLGTGEVRAHARRFGLDGTEWRILAVLGDGAPVSVVETAARGALEKGRTARAAQALSRRGLVERTHDPFDARRTVLRLTTKGRALYRRATLVARARERLLLAALAPGEQRVLARLLAKLQRAAEKALGSRTAD
jgi:DNA-binding MarR family transcriptional regulator